MGTSLRTISYSQICFKGPEHLHCTVLCTNKLCRPGREQLQAIVQKTPKRDIQIVMGDLNAKVGEVNTYWKGTMGTEGLGGMNANGVLFAYFCAFNELVIGGSLFPHKPTHKATWVSADSKTENQTDHIAITRKWRNVLLDVRVKRGADIDSDHHLLVGEFRMKLAVKKRSGDRAQRRFDTGKLQDHQVRWEVGVALRNRFQVLSEEESVEDMWIQCRDTLTGTCEQLLGYRGVKRKDWITDDTWKATEERRAIEHRCNRESDSTKKEELRKEYKQKNRAVKKKTKRDRKSYIDELASEVEVAAKQHNPKELYKITRLLAGRNRSTNRPVKNKQGNLLTRESQQRERWREHFQELLNRPPPDVPPDVSESRIYRSTVGGYQRRKSKELSKSLNLERHLDSTTYHQTS